MAMRQVAFRGTVASALVGRAGMYVRPDQAADEIRALNLCRQRFLNSATIVPEVISARYGAIVEEPGDVIPVDLQ